jgi:transposase
VPAGKIVHVILDNYAAHKQPKVLAWLARHPRFTFHFTPTSCSWLNAVETFFATLTKRRLKRGVFRSVVDLQTAINRYLREANHDPKPFLWTADPDIPSRYSSSSLMTRPTLLELQLQPARMHRRVQMFIRSASP